MKTYKIAGIQYKIKESKYQLYNKSGEAVDGTADIDGQEIRLCFSKKAKNHKPHKSKKLCPLCYLRYCLNLNKKK